MSSIAWISPRVSRCGDVCGDMMTDRRAHTRAAGGARRETGSATDAGTAGSPRNGTHCAGAIDRAQDPRLGGSVGQTLVGQRESRASQQGEREPEQGRELLDASPELQDFLLKFRSSGPSRPGSPRLSAPRRATHGPSSAGLRDPWRWSRPRCVGRDPEADGRSAAAGGPWSAWR